MANIVYFTVRQSWRDPPTVKSYPWPTSNPRLRAEKKENYTTRATADFLFCCRKFQHGILSYGFSVWNCKYRDNNSRTRCCVQHPGRIENKTGIKWNMYTHSDYQKHKVAYLVKCFLFNLLSVSEGCVFTKWYHVSRTE